MKKIYLFCSAGMSTSMLASKMQSVADEHSLPIEVKAYPHDRLGEIIESLHPDCILLGPQVKYLYEKTVNDFGKDGIPIAVIDSGDYGMMNGEKVLKTAIKLIKSAKK
ncbi:PTS sugar transporter subunit IIB [Clostridium fallax]|uniref:PTS system, cellobiose-specific IIB component n=1 Tax=Clostridium fallax TaxID=1533 RepID=A0A1M4YGB3_9CLOT|nr:PTS sugar transporter subunit IIB [Clostridium fallax]SHF04708.1 PTS system, cellobiose-specific IIB component [Clostridium fallax]SQB22332.1 Phosphotransferase system cellobiose-specific component IIB [Clostridium fallax]